MRHIGVEAKDKCTAEEAVFHWDIARDRLHWGGAIREVLQVDDPARLDSTRAWLLHLDTPHADLRHEALREAFERGHREYAVSYRFMPEGREEERGFMVLEEGRWMPDANGEPAHVFGVIRRLSCLTDGDCMPANLPMQMDPTSGLFCRSYFFKRLEEFLEHQAPKDQHAALLILSVSNYSIIFDAYGFEAADAAYSEVARRLNRVLRAGDIIARYGDNRIAMLIHDCAEDDLEPALRRFLHTPMSEPIETPQGPVWPMLAIGAVLLPQHAQTITEAISCAEEALAEAEARPSSSAITFVPSQNRISRRAMKARFANEIFDALKQRRFTLAFQPVVRADDGTPIYHEALLRLLKGQETAPASHLIPVAEELGLIRLLDLEVLDLALEALRMQPEGKLGINISATTVMDGRAFLDHLAEHEDTVRDRLIIEITESAMLGDAERVNSFIARAHALGCKVALDDFGSGYTSFRNLRDMDFDIVKLDGAFCENLSDNEENQHFVRSLIELASRTGIQIVAEWVEREEDAALLREWGVHGMQGYLFGQPGRGRESQWRHPVLGKDDVAAVFGERPVLASQETVAGTEEAEEADTPRVQETPSPGTAAKEAPLTTDTAGGTEEAEAKAEATTATVDEVAASDAVKPADEVERAEEAGAVGMLETAGEAEAAREEKKDDAVEAAREAETANGEESGKATGTDEAVRTSEETGVDASPGDLSGESAETGGESEVAPADNSLPPTAEDKVGALMRALEADLKELRQMLLDMRGQKGNASDVRVSEEKTSVADADEHDGKGQAATV